MRRLKKIGKWLFYTLCFIILLLITIGIYMIQVSKVANPIVKSTSSQQLERNTISNDFYTLKNSWFKKNKHGLYELYVEGNGFESGVINGKLTKELVVRQEYHFSEQINKMIPSSFTRNYLKYFIGWFNRNLDENITEEYRDEIFGVSRSASTQYEYLGSNYQRILNYHAAHDIGHAIQNLALVGCTSFGTWGDKSADSTLIIGRNFDFYVGDKFAEDKIVAFFSPSKGYKFMTITWGGFIGAVSGMNEAGLSVTINAAKSDYPSGSATPVSLVTREILQYAKNISEATAIASKRKMFVSESFLLASAEDNKAIIIEKTPTALDVYDPNQNSIICTNHFQSNSLANTKKNKEQVTESASAYRHERVKELLDAQGKNTVPKTIAILRDRKGINNANIGEGNEKAINQLIAHHSVVFEPQKLLVWVSTAPWQLGKYVAYDLKKVFNLSGLKKDIEIADTSLFIPADSFLLSQSYKNFIAYRSMKERIAHNERVNLDSLIASNAELYYTYVLAGDYANKQKQYKNALKFYQTALTKTIATKNEEYYIQKQITLLKEKE